MSYQELVKSLEEFDGLSWEAEYDLEWNGETISITMENDLEVIHESRRAFNSGFGSEWEWESTGKRTFKGGDHWKLNYYLEHNAPNLEKLLDSQIISKAGNILLFTKEEFLGVLEWLDHKGVVFKEAE
jgi:hypothetical protein